MTKTYSALTAISLKTGVTYLHPHEPAEVAHLDDSALASMVDFKYLQALTIAPDEDIDTALIGVKNSPSHVLLVVNNDQHIVGIITAEDLLGEKPLRAIQERRIPRSELEVQMVMTPQQEILAIDMENLRHAKVGHIVETLRAHKQHYALVVKIDEKTHHPSVRGLFSSAILSKQLGQDILSTSPEGALSIAELQHGLRLVDD